VATAKKNAKPTDGTAAVDAFMEDFDHPMKAEMEALRIIIRSVDAAIEEGIKWNGPSFRCNEYFATFHTRPRDFVHVIFHKGAKVRGSDKPDATVDDPSGLLQWLGRDRCAAKFHDMKDIEDKKTAFEHIVRQWIADLRIPDLR
jgi:hypothetical protein